MEEKYKIDEQGTLVEYYGSGASAITIPNGVKSIGHGVFSYHTDLQRIIIPDSVEYIGKNAFSGCTGLRSVAFPENDGCALVSRRGESHFAGCFHLSEIQFGIVPSFYYRYYYTEEDGDKTDFYDEEFCEPDYDSHRYYRTTFKENLSFSELFPDSVIQHIVYTGYISMEDLRRKLGKVKKNLLSITVPRWIHGLYSTVKISENVSSMQSVRKKLKFS